MIMSLKMKQDLLKSVAFDFFFIGFLKFFPFIVFDICLLLNKLSHIHVEIESHSVMSDSLDPMDYIACSALLSMEFFRKEYWSGLPFPSPWDLPDPGIDPGLLHCR